MIAPTMPPIKPALTAESSSSSSATIGKSVGSSLSGIECDNRRHVCWHVVQRWKINKYILVVCGMYGGNHKKGYKAWLES